MLDLLMDKVQHICLFKFEKKVLILPTVSLYIHWPFCESKCPYCDFNSHVIRSITEDEWIKCLIHEMCRYHALTANRRIKTIFFGGGTPSLMSAKTIEAVIQKAFQLWQLTQPLDVEITMEANPSSVEAQRFLEYKIAGINRLSLGVQALNDNDLQLLGRKHSVESALKALDIAQNTFQRVSLDLIYARPKQTLMAWRDELEYALSFGTTHMSLYQLTIEPGTAFEPQYLRGDLVIPAENDAYDLYKLTDNMTLQKNLGAYEISNYAQEEFECLHNLTYWNYEDYIGIGPGAHGRITINDGDENQFSKIATQQIKAPLTWAKKIMDQGHGDEIISKIDEETQFHEQIMMGFRLHNGILKKNLIRDWLPIEQNRLLVLKAEELLEENATHYKLTKKGQLVLNSILQYLWR